MIKVPRSLLVTAFVMVASGTFFGIVWSPVPPHTLNLVGVPGPRKEVVVYPKEPPAFKPLEDDVRWVSLPLFLNAPQSLNANVGVYARTKDVTQDPSCVPLTARLQNPSINGDFSAYVCAVSANDSKVGEALFENAKYASLEGVSAPGASTIAEGIQKGKLWLGVDPSSLPPTPITLQLRLSGAGYVSPSPGLLNIALIGLLVFLMGQAVYRFAARASSGKAALWRHPLMRLSKFGIVLGLGVVLLGAVLDVLNHGIGGMPRSTLFAALSTSLSASCLLPEIDFAENSIEDKTLRFFAGTAGAVLTLGVVLAVLLRFLPNQLALLF
jgi:xanthosine utilization system XapX-like protein